MLPPTSPRLVPMEPSLDVSQVSLTPQRTDDDASDALGSMEPMDSMVVRVGGWGRRVAWTLGTLAVAGLVGVVMLASSGSTSAEADPAIADAAVEGQGAGRGAPVAARTTAAPSRAAAEHRPAPGEAIDERSPAPEAPAGGEPAVHDDDALVHDALMQRKIRALDILLVSPEATRKIKGRRIPRVLHTHWSGAEAYCEQLEIDGVAGWRLPTAGEFRTLGTSNMLGRRIYWSATEGDAFGSDRVVWNNQKKRMAPAPSTWKGGRVLCVRFQHPDRVPS